MFLCLIVVVVILAYFWIQNRFSFWERRGFPFVPAKFPLGSVGELSGKMHSSELFQKFYEDNKGKAPALGIFLGMKPALLPLEPELVRDILVKHFDHFHDRGFYCNEKDDPLSAHLFALSGQKWKDLRSKLTPTFTSGKIKMMFDTVSTTCDRMIDFVRPVDCDSHDLEMKEILSSFTTEVISSVAFGLETNCLGNPDNEFRWMAKAVFEPPNWQTLKFLFISSFPKISKMMRLSLTRTDVTRFFMKVITSSLTHREKSGTSRNDFLQLLINLKSSHSGMTLSDIAANSFVFFLAG